MCNVIIQLINYFQIIVFTFLSDFYVSASIPETPFFCKTCIYYCLYLTSGRSSHTGSICVTVYKLGIRGFMALLMLITYPDRLHSGGLFHCYTLDASIYHFSGVGSIWSLLI